MPVKWFKLIVVQMPVLWKAAMLRPGKNLQTSLTPSSLGPGRAPPCVTGEMSSTSAQQLSLTFIMRKIGVSTHK